MPEGMMPGAGGMPMMDMMRMMMGQDGMPMMATMTGHVEGRLAFLKTELKIMCPPNTDVTISAIYKCHCGRAAGERGARA